MQIENYDNQGRLKSTATGGGASNLDGLSDVAITAAAQGDILTRKATQFENENIAVNEVVYRAGTGDVTGLAMAASTFLARLASGDIVAATVAQVKTLLAYTVSEITNAAHTALNNLASVAINTSLISDTDNTDDLGSSAIKWASFFGFAAVFEERTAPGTPAASDVVLYAKSDGLLYSKDDAGTETLVSGGTGSGSRVQVAQVSDTKTQSTAGGTFTSGAWQIRDLQTEDYDPNTIVSLSTNQFTLVAGEYLIRWSAPAHAVNRHKSRLYDVTGAAVVAYGGAVHTSSATTAILSSIGSARVNISSSTAYRIEHRCETTKATDGYGIATGFEVEIYTQVEIIRLGNNV